MRPLWKTTIVIWSEYNPTATPIELSDLALDAEQGESYCARYRSENIAQPEKDPDWDGTEFFDFDNE